jgi:uncharacterized membrane protein YagU involved in acid resistance
MTAYQLSVRKLRGERLDTPVPRTWDEAEAPAQVAKKAARLLGHDRAITKQDAPLATQVMHWLYGTGWGVGYGILAARYRPRPLVGAAALGVAVWTAAYAQLVPLGIYEPPWRYQPAELGLDLSYHLVYGAGVAAAYATLGG